jgi:hypothetical protein
MYDSYEEWTMFNQCMLRFLSLRPVSLYVHETSQFSSRCAERTREPD